MYCMHVSPRGSKVWLRNALGALRHPLAAQRMFAFRPLPLPGVRLVKTKHWGSYRKNIHGCMAEGKAPGQITVCWQKM